MRLPLIEKYRAASFSEIKGQDLAIQDIRDFFESFPKKRAIILNGAVGTGKTSMVLALAKEYDLELFELNASDLRNKSSLEAVLKPSTQQSSLFQKGKLILMDEADGITGSDRGGVSELIRLIAETQFPIVITANDIWQKKFSPLRQKCKIINLKELDESVIREILYGVIDKEGKKLSQETFDLIVKKSQGDARAALNDLELALNLGEGEFINELSEREKRDDIFNVLKNVFQAPTDLGIVRAYDSVHMDLNEISLWIEENIPLEYKGEALVKAYDALSKADIFKGRIYRQQHWRFLVYQNFFLSAGISSATKVKYNKFTKYQKPSRILKIWLANQRNAKRKSVMGKCARLCHMSKKKMMKEAFLMPFILSELGDRDKARLDLDEKEAAYIEDKKVSLILANGLNRFRV
ncbi:replication factor C large subunit [archaeon]|jgi:replication factor C large subunit|nr:replication factor C large subunit [archaeon]